MRLAATVKGVLAGWSSITASFALYFQYPRYLQSLQERHNEISLAAYSHH